MYLVDPRDVTKYDRTQHELELFWLFCLVVAGKTAATQVKALRNFLLSLDGLSPFDKIRDALTRGILRDKIIESRLGQYNRLTKAFEQSLALDLFTCTVEDLEAIAGVGPKTARMFLMHSRRDQRYAALDTHILKFLTIRGHTTLKSTPSVKNYKKLEKIFLDIADSMNITPADLDLSIWKSYARH